MDGFEKHIRNNRDQFDEHKADREKMWKHIQAGLEEKKAGDMPKIIPLWKRGWFMVAASIAIVVGLGITLLFNQPSPTQLAETTELLEIDLYYENIVAQQVKMVNDSEELSKEEKAEFLQFMDELDEEYKLLKGELNKGLDNEQVLEAIVIHYQKRIDVIQSLLTRINQSKKESNEKGIFL